MDDSNDSNGSNEKIAMKKIRMKKIKCLNVYRGTYIEEHKEFLFFRLCKFFSEIYETKFLEEI